MNSGSLAEVWSQVLQLLPEYMLPTSIARVSAMPLTGNGKLHAKKLADSMLESRGRPTRAVPEVQSVGVSAANSSSIDSIDSKRSGRPDIQHHLIQIWTELFAKPVAADDNFFDLGGNSLFAVRMSSRLRQRGLPSLHPRDLYTHQTIARLSAVLVADADGA
jgi:aryl carrier-like protein